MREIKFRAWWRDAKLMEEVVTLREGEISILVPLKPNSLGQKYEHQTLEEGQYDLMQFTGLHDKNGKEIYEGDIVRTGYNDGEPAVVEFATNNSVGHPINGYWGKCKGDNAITIYPSKMEVIGNIYENGDLLK